MLILLRHGRTELNASGRLQGRQDLSLDQLGEQQASEAAHRILELTHARGGLDEVIASPLARAQQTASRLGQSVRTEERWIEMNYGIYEGCPIGDIPPDVWERWYRDAHFAPEGAESFAALQRRVADALDDIFEAASQGNVVVVAHAMSIKAALATCLKTSHRAMFHLKIDQAAMSVIEYGRFGTVLARHNEAPALR